MYKQDLALNNHKGWYAEKNNQLRELVIFVLLSSCVSY